MRYHKYRYSFHKWLKLKKWDPYKGYRRGKRYHKLLSSGYFENQTWGALQKCWLGFTIAKEKAEWDKIEMYARRIKRLEKELGLTQTDFSDWGVE